MKTSLAIILAAGLTAAQAQDQNPNEITARLPERLPDAHLEFDYQPPNEIIHGRYTYTGVFVQMAKTDQPWQLINPLAPSAYGSGDYNLYRDMATGQPRGFKFFTIKF